MNTRARLERLEKAMRGQHNIMDPEKINGVFHYLKTGEAARNTVIGKTDSPRQINQPKRDSVEPACSKPRLP